MAAIAGLAVLGVSAFAFFDPTIAISKALGSNSISVHYSGTHARTVELVVNGQSMASRTVSTADSSGDVYFSLDPTALQDGANNVEIKIYNTRGRLVGVQKATITAGTEFQSPFFMKYPQMGQTVQGAVSITLGMTQNFASPYVSFFIDNKLKAFTNTPPFEYNWDTTAVPNGWHTLQSWLVSQNDTFKTQTLKIFVNNPGGLTPREDQGQVEPAKTAPVTPAVIKTNPAGTSPVAPKVTPAKVVMPTIGKVALNPINLPLQGSSQSTRPIKGLAPIMAGPRQLVPKYVTAPPKAGVNVNPNEVALTHPNLTRFVAIENGTHLMDSNSGYMTGSFSILLNGAVVSFDVQPRIDEGIPMTPIRYLLEQDGGQVHWNNQTKTVTAQDEGKQLWIKIGADIAKVDATSIQLDKAAYIDGSRTIVPLSFVRDALKVDVQYDKTTNHVLITTKK